jgi:hypothetical protein
MCRVSHSKKLNFPTSSMCNDERLQGMEGWRYIYSRVDLLQQDEVIINYGNALCSSDTTPLLIYHGIGT